MSIFLCLIQIEINVEHSKDADHFSTGRAHTKPPTL